MKKWNDVSGLSIILCWLFAISCASDSRPVATRTELPLDKLNFTVEAADDWTSLFYRKSGWFGADGIFSIQRDGVDTPGAAKDSETMLLFSDTMIGEIVGDSLQPGYTMVHNSVALIRGDEPRKDSIHFYVNQKDGGKPESMFTPSTPHSQPGEYYWLGDGFVNRALNDATYIFAYRIKDTSDAAFGFSERGTTLIKIPKNSRPPFRDQQQMDTPLFLPGDAVTAGTFGSCIFNNTREAGYPTADGYVYIYGIRGKEKHVMVARVKPGDFENFQKWRYWDGEHWNEDIHSAANITDRASNELSVTPLPDGRFAMVFQTDGLGRSVGLRLSRRPQMYTYPSAVG